MNLRHLALAIAPVIAFPAAGYAEDSGPTGVRGGSSASGNRISARAPFNSPDAHR
jgi:hypothetical protein